MRPWIHGFTKFCYSCTKISIHISNSEVPNQNVTPLYAEITNVMNPLGNKNVRSKRWYYKFSAKTFSL